MLLLIVSTKILRLSVKLAIVRPSWNCKTLSGGKIIRGSVLTTLSTIFKQEIVVLVSLVVLLLSKLFSSFLATCSNSSSESLMVKSKWTSAIANDGALLSVA